MRDMQREACGRYRAIKATAIVMALVLMAPGVEALARVGPALAEPHAASAGIDARLLAQASDPYAALDRIEDFASADGALLPEPFAREVGLLPGAEDVRADATGTVVGYVVQGEAADVFEELRAHMEAAGWSAVPLGELEGATFVKERGDCTWALSTCTQVGPSTSVVVRCMHT